MPMRRIEERKGDKLRDTASSALFWTRRYMLSLTLDDLSLGFDCMFALHEHVWPFIGKGGEKDQPSERQYGEVNVKGI